MMELTMYLEQTEVRHQKQADILEKIGEMISPRFSKRKHRKHLRKSVTPLPQKAPSTAKASVEPAVKPIVEPALPLSQIKPSPMPNVADHLRPIKAPKRELSIEHIKRFDLQISATLPPSPQEVSVKAHDVIMLQSHETQDQSPEIKAGPPVYQTLVIPVNSIEVSPQDSSDSESEQLHDAQTQTEPAMQANPAAGDPATFAVAKAPPKHLFQSQLEKLPKKSPPMAEPNFFKLFELAMDEKAKADEVDRQQFKPLRSMTEFMLDFMFMQYGLKSLALKNLSSLVNSLERMSLSQHRYGVLFCRLLEIFTDQPIGLKLGAFFARARACFVGVQGKSSSKRVMEQGGEALLTDVYDLIPKIFASVRPR
jgi:hypothetical protein